VQVSLVNETYTHRTLFKRELSFDICLSTCLCVVHVYALCMCMLAVYDVLAMATTGRCSSAHFSGGIFDVNNAAACGGMGWLR